jgi:hypothetical protein
MHDKRTNGYAYVSGRLFYLPKVIEKINFSTRKIGYLFYNFIRATYLTVFLHCMIYGKTLVGVESWPSWTRVTIKIPFSPASLHFSVGADCTILCYLPFMCLN